MLPELIILHKHLRLPFWHRADIEAELASHLAEVTAELRAQGVAEAEAQQAAVARLGDLEEVAGELQEIHRNWAGGATVQIRFAKVVLGVVTLLILAVFWLATVGRTLTNGSWTEEEHADIQVLSQASYEVPDQAKFNNILNIWREQQPNVVWTGIINRSGVLVFSSAKTGMEGKRIPNSDAFLVKSRRGSTIGPTSGNAGSKEIAPLAKQLAVAGIPMHSLHCLTLGEWDEGSFNGTALIAYGYAPAGDVLLAALSSYRFWYGVIWLLAAAAILLHRRQANPREAWFWAIFALLFGPLVWLGYLLLAWRKATVNAGEEKIRRRLLLLPALGVLFTLLLMCSAVVTVPVGWLELHFLQPRRGAELLSQSQTGLKLVFAGAQDDDFATRQAAVVTLTNLAKRSVVSNGSRATCDLAAWAQLLNSKYPATREAGFNGVLIISKYHTEEVDANQLYQIWKMMLSHQDAEIRQQAWTNFSLSVQLNQADRSFPYNAFPQKIPELMALGRPAENKPANQPTAP